MVLGIVSKVIPPLIQGLKIFSKYEGKTYTKLYGVSRGRGVRHGLASGGVVGTLINQDNTELDDGKIPSNEYGNKASSKNKARSGFKRNSSRNYSAKYRNYKSNRYACSCKHNSSYYRK